MDPSIPAQFISIRNTTTKAVTLYPNKAQITRAISSIALRPGPNTVVITGITPTCDEHSIKVDGTGSATITDLTVELINNPEIYLDIYPDEEEDDNSDIPSPPDSDSEGEGREAEIKFRLKTLGDERRKFADQLSAENTIKQACESYIRVDRNYGPAAEGCQPPPFKEFLETFRTERQKPVEEIAVLNKCMEEIEKEAKKLRKEQERLTLEARRAKLKAEKEEQKRQIKEQRKLREQQKEKEKIHQERVRFWPKKVYKVTISLEAPDGYTPASSRRGSVASVESLVKERARSETPIGEAEVNLTLTYITTSASWSPRYDLSLSTVFCTGQLDYAAELINTTSEAWKDAKITLSTSQTRYGGLTDEIPVLLPWHLRIVGWRSYTNMNKSALRASYEITALNQHTDALQETEKPRHQLFGLDQEYLDIATITMRKSKPVSKLAVSQNKPMVALPPKPGAQTSLVGQPAQILQQQSLFGSASAGETPAEAVEQFGSVVPAPGLVGSAAPAAASAAARASGGLFGNSGASGPTVAAGAPVPRPGGLFRSMRSSAAPAAFGKRAGMASAAPNAPVQEEYYDFDSHTAPLPDEDNDQKIHEQGQALLVEESVFEESGLTAAYDLPGLKTLSPTSTKSKHKITRIEFRNVAYSHIIVPKLRPAAFLKARLKNLSKITLLKSDCGLTLDGTFLGHSSIPRCEGGEGFTLNLGIDPSVQINYSKPTVRRGTTGTGLSVFGGNKENNEVFTRTTTITNTKSSTPLDLTLLEQVPVSEDERLKIHITEPRGLAVGGAKQWAGAPKEDPDNKDAGASDWGSATAVAKKGGEVTYSVKINPGKGCKVNLEYELAYPGDEQVVSA